MMYEKREYSFKAYLRIAFNKMEVFVMLNELSSNKTEHLYSTHNFLLNEATSPLNYKIHFKIWNESGNAPQVDQFGKEQKSLVFWCLDQFLVFVRIYLFLRVF